MSLVIEPLTGRIGAQISGVKLSADLDESTFAALHRALLEHKVIFLRDQHLSDDEHEAFSRRLGEQVPHPTVRSAERSAAILNLDSRHSRANSWHTDVTFVVDYPKISILRGVVIPDRGGDTVWANTAAAYADLPEPLKALADGLRALHSNVYDYAPSRHAEANGLRRYREEFTAEVYETEHPLVQIHPETGECALVLGHFVKQIQGVSANDSKQLLRLFQDRITALENTVRWRWRTGDVVLWDNRATQHIAVDDYGSAERIVRRTTIAGEVPLGVDGRPSQAIRPSAEARSPRSEADKKHLAA